MSRYLICILLFAVTSPLRSAAADCELQLDLLTPVYESGSTSTQWGTMPGVSAGFPGLTIGVFSDDLEAVAGDNRCGLAAQYDRVHWGARSYSAAALLVSWRQAIVRQRSWRLWLSLYAGPSWYDGEMESTRQPEHVAILDIVWKVAPAVELSLPVRHRSALLAGLRYMQHLNNKTDLGPFESGLVCYAGVGVHLN